MHGVAAREAAVGLRQVSQHDVAKVLAIKVLLGGLCSARHASLIASCNIDPSGIILQTLQLSLLWLFFYIFL